MHIVMGTDEDFGTMLDLTMPVHGSVVGVNVKAVLVYGFDVLQSMVSAGLTFSTPRFSVTVKADVEMMTLSLVLAGNQAKVLSGFKRGIKVS